jgi:hypothetical protein
MQYDKVDGKEFDQLALPRKIILNECGYSIISLHICLAHCCGSEYFNLDTYFQLIAVLKRKSDLGTI